MKGILSILVILFSLCSCQESEKGKVAHLIKKWEVKKGELILMQIWCK